MSNSNYHYSVLLNESIDALQIKSDGIYVDCTLGRAGHTKKILEQLNDKGKLIAIDRDQEAIEWTKNNIRDDRLILVNKSFSNLKNILDENNITEVNGILFDLGVSSPQLDDSTRGFSYHNDARLDMRMDLNQELDAHYIVNNYTCEQLTKIFKEYGESKYCLQVAKKITETRKIKTINTTLELVDIIKEVLPKKELFNKKHPARVFFQAIRMEVNDELNQIKIAVNDALKLLSKNNGRLVVISFHSLENKMIKDIFKEYTTDKTPSYLPTSSNVEYIKIKSSKLSEKEIQENNRSRSARLHIIERRKYEK